MSNKYCQALVELRNKPAHELKEVGDQWRTPDNIFWGINTCLARLFWICLLMVITPNVPRITLRKTTRWRMTGQNVLRSLKVLPLVIPRTRGNPQTGTPATDLDDDYFDMLQEELCSVVEASGASLEKGRHDQLLTALRALLLSRKNPFGDIKLDGTVQKALENLGLGEAAKRNVGTGANQIPDMGSFMLSASVPGYQKLPSGLIIQWGPIDVPLTSQDTVTYFPIAFPNRCLRVFATQDYTPGSANVGYIACAGYNQDPVKFISRAGVPGIGASFFALGC